MQTKSSMPNPGSSAKTPSQIRMASGNGSSRVKMSRNHRLKGM